MTPVRWLRPVASDPAPTARLILFHHSGGSAAAYAPWRAYLPSDIRADAVQLPGRQERAHETAFTRLELLAEVVADIIGPELDDLPYALFGHSMGAMLAYRTAVALAARDWPAPALIGVSGWAPEGFTPLESALDDAGALAALRALGDAVPPELERDPDALAALVRVMSADAAVCADFQDDGAYVASPIAAYAGRDDPLLKPGAMQSWAARTPRYLGCRTFPGEHYYLREHAAQVAADVAELLRRNIAVG